MMTLINDDGLIEKLREIDGVFPIKKAAGFLGVSNGHFYRIVRPTLPVVKLGPGRLGVRLSDLRKWRDERVVQPAMAG